MRNKLHIPIGVGSELDMDQIHPWNGLGRDFRGTYGFDWIEIGGM